MSDTTRKITTEHAITPFGLNSVCEFSYRKSERIALAIHLITNFLPRGESIRTHLRDKSIQLVSDILTLREGLRASGPDRVNDIIARLTEIITLLEIANAAGYVSQMNAGLIGKECRKLAAFLREHEDTSSAESTVLRASYFPEAHGHATAAHDKGQKSIKDNIKDKHALSQTSREAFREKRSKRKEILLSLVRERGRLSVKDAAAVIADCSEKTLQRELTALVAEGVLGREGERRWSVYVASPALD